MKIYSWNVNGIRAVERKGLLRPFLEEHDPDILCIQETKAHQEQVDIDYPQYKEFWHSAERKGYSGTAIFAKKEPQEVIYGIPEHIAKKYPLADEYGDTTKEGRVLTLEYKDFYINTVYTPNAKDDLSRIPMRQAWDPAYKAFMESLEVEKPVIFCGDFNVAHTPDDLARPKENEGNKGFTQEERAGFDALIDAGFIDTLRLFHKGNGHYTWWSHWGGARERNVGWRIDYILTSPLLEKKITGAHIHPEVMGSDHCPVSLEVNI